MRNFIIEFSIDDENDSTLKEIENDVKMELSCCWNCIDVKNIRVKELPEKTLKLRTKMTNLEKLKVDINSLSIDELCQKYILDVDVFGNYKLSNIVAKAKFCPDKNIKCHNCLGCFKKWLKSEVEE